MILSVISFLPNIHHPQVAALMACGAADLGDPFFPPPLVLASGEASGSGVIPALSRGVSALRRSFRGTAGAVTGASTATTASPFSYAPKPWELSAADVKAIRVSLSSKGKREGRHLSNTVVLPFSASGGSATEGLPPNTALPSVPGLTGLTSSDSWATGCGLSVDEFDYLTDIHLGLSNTEGGGAGGRPSAAAAAAAAAASDGGGDATASATGGGDSSSASGGGRSAINPATMAGLAGLSMDGFNPLAYLTGEWHSLASDRSIGTLVDLGLIATT